jgi:hypothetical protein
MADNVTAHDLLALIKDCQSRGLMKKAANEVCTTRMYHSMVRDSIVGMVLIML